ncbi:hypothetical protein ACVWW4_002092 [Bradyrhizobium sp. LB7.1]
MTAVRARWPRSFNLAATAFFFTSLLSHAHGAEQPASRDMPKLGRGINILGYDGIWEGGQNAPFRLNNLTSIKKAGFSHVRINFFGFKFMGPGKCPGRDRPEAARRRHRGRSCKETRSHRR